MPPEPIREICEIAVQSCATTAQRGGVDVDADLMLPAAQEMRAGPSDSECRLRVQTTGCCVDPMVGVVSETGNGGMKPVRCGLERRTQVNRCRGVEMMRRHQNQAAIEALGAMRAMPADGPCDDRRRGGVSPVQARVRNVGTCPRDAKGAHQHGDPVEVLSTEARGRGGWVRSSEEPW